MFFGLCFGGELEVGRVVWVVGGVYGRVCLWWWVFLIDFLVGAGFWIGFMGYFLSLFGVG